ncbi:MAG: GH116 family glycosyl hydrolase, partial [bacterium]|nr:GH116 family glycosyl hydrolase [bacterium]
MKTVRIFSSFLGFLLLCLGGNSSVIAEISQREYNGPYTGANLNRLAFPLGGIGTGMVCLEGSGALSHVSVRNRMDVFHEPFQFAAISIKGEAGKARVVEGPVPGWKIFGAPGTGNGAGDRTYGFPRFPEASFLARFPFGTVRLHDEKMPLNVEITGWSPFIPGDEDNSSLPVAALEYQFTNTTNEPLEAIFSYHAVNFMRMGNEGNSVQPFDNGFVLYQEGTEANPEYEGAFAIFTNDNQTVIDHGWFKGGWWDARTLIWETIASASILANPPQTGSVPGASLYVPLSLQPNESKTLRLMLCWVVPKTNIRIGEDPEGTVCEGGACCPTSQFHTPWYAGKFGSITEAARYWIRHYDDLRHNSALFRDAFYGMSLAPEVLEAIAANLTILKSPTVQRQADGRLWCFEGCNDTSGCCHGSCTHVWNYAQAIAHLFPSLERSLRETEFTVSQDETGHQTFRTNLPIRPTKHTFHAASDGQLGGIMKVYREWRISGDTLWLKSLWPKIKASMDYGIATWDPREKGVLEEPHHNTYDIEFWGPDGMCSSFYLGALQAFIEMGKAMGEDWTRYQSLLEKGKAFLETQLFNGEYFIQKIQTDGLSNPFHPIDASGSGPGYAAIVEQLNQQGPKYQYGDGCISDGVLGFWIAEMCGLNQSIVDEAMIQKHLLSVYQYNLKHDLSEHANPQRPSYAFGNEGGLLLCTWPKGSSLSLPFVYSNEVWTGIEYQVAAHLMLQG